MPWSEESANRALELIRSRIAQGATIDEAMAIFLPSGHAINLVLARAAQWLEVKKREAKAGDRSPTYVRELERYLTPNGHFSWWTGRSICIGKIKKINIKFRRKLHHEKCFQF